MWATAQYLAYAPTGTVLDWEVVLPATGRNTTQGRAIGRLGAEEVLTVNAALGSHDLDLSGTWVQFPDVPAPEDCPVQQIPPMFADTVLVRVEQRLARGRLMVELDGTPGDANSAFWTRVPGHLEPSAATLAVIGDFVSGGVSQPLGVRTMGRSLDNTLRVAQLVPTEWVLCDIHMHALAHGFGQGLAHLWAQDGTLLGNGQPVHQRAPMARRQRRGVGRGALEDDLRTTRTMMRTRKIGSLEVSVVGLGCNNFGGRLDYDGSAAVVHEALDAGITFFDTADIYGGTRSEEFLGRALGARRADIVLATKFGMQVDAEHKGAKPDYVHRALEDSLRRLQTDHVDLYQLHAPDPDTPIAETLGALDECVRAGKALEIGCSNFTVAQLREAEAAATDGVGPFRQRAERVQPVAPEGRARRAPRVRTGRPRLPALLPPGVGGAHRQVPARPATSRRHPAVGGEAERGAAVRRHCSPWWSSSPNSRRAQGPEHGGARHRLDRRPPARGLGHRRGHLARAGPRQCRRRRLGARRRRPGRDRRADTGDVKQAGDLAQTDTQLRGH